MKTRVLIILSIFISILIGCETTNSENGDIISFYYDQIGKVEMNLIDCNVDSEIISNFRKDTKNYDECRMYNMKEVDLEQHKRCINNLDQLTCEEVSKITSIEELKNIEDCFQFPLSTKKKACIHNVNDYCEEIYKNCGEEYLIDICENSFETWGSDESPEHGLNDEMVDNYCDSTVDKDQKITDQFDLFIYQCENYSIDCDNIEMLDFRDPEWKNSCSE